MCQAKTVDSVKVLLFLRRQRHCRKHQTSVACLCLLCRVSLPCGGNVPHNQVNCLVMIAMVPGVMDSMYTTVLWWLYVGSKQTCGAIVFSRYLSFQMNSISEHIEYRLV